MLALTLMEPFLTANTCIHTYVDTYIHTRAGTHLDGAPLHGRHLGGSSQLVRLRVRLNLSRQIAAVEKHLFAASPSAQFRHATSHSFYFSCACERSSYSKCIIYAFSHKLRTCIDTEMYTCIQYSRGVPKLEGMKWWREISSLGHAVAGNKSQPKAVSVGNTSTVCWF